MFVPGFQNDIFVSYANVDDHPLPGAGKGWVSTLVGCLKIRLAQKLGRSDAFSLWMDHELLGAKPITQQLLDMARNSATLVVVLSPGYAASSWCARERDAFLEFVREQDGCRFFVVERDAVNDAERPMEFRDLKGFRFWVRDREGRPPRILGSPAPNPNEPEYYSRVDDLSQELAETLKRLKTSSRPSDARTLAELAEPPLQGLSECPTVFLAQVTDDLEIQRNSVKRFLNQAGIRVVPEVWYSQDPEAFRRAVSRDLTESELFVQLLSAVPGKKPPDLPEGYLRCQLDQATAVGRPITQWRDVGLELGEVEDQDHRALLQGPGVRAEPLQDFKQQVRQLVLDKPVTRNPTKPSAFVFVDMDSSDRPLAQQVCDLLERHGAGYALPLDASDPGEFRRDLEQNLAECDALIVIYGEATAGWVRGQIRECQKTVARRQRPLRSLAVFEGPPEQKPSLGMSLPNMRMRVVNCRNGLCSKQVAAFLDSVAVEDEP